MEGESTKDTKTTKGEANGLPAGWVWATIGEVAAVNPRDRTIRDLPDDMPVTFVPMAAVDAESGRIATPDVRVLGQVRKGFTSFSDGDVLMAKITPSMENGKAAIARNLTNGLGFGSTEFHVMRPSEAVTAEYLFHFIRQVPFREEAKANFAGTAGQLRVPSRFIADHPLPLPPVSEQQLIVTKLEELLTRLDAGVAGLKRVQAALKRYRAAVLKAACEGRLVPQDPNDEPAAKLLERILAERRARWAADLRAKGKDPAKAKYDEPAGPEVEGLPELPEGWCWASLEGLATLRNGANFTKEQKSESAGVLMVDVMNMYAQGIGINLDNLYRVNAKLSPDHLLKPGDVLFVRSSVKRQGVGWTSMFLEYIEPVAFCGFIIRARLNSSEIMPAYITYFMRTHGARDTIVSRSSQVTITNINQTALGSITIPIPPPREQQRIVLELERRLSLLQALDQVVSANIARVERLRQAVLRRAFEGRLLSMD